MNAIRSRSWLVRATRSNSRNRNVRFVKVFFGDFGAVRQRYFSSSSSCRVSVAASLRFGTGGSPLSVKSRPLISAHPLMRHFSAKQSKEEDRWVRREDKDTKKVFYYNEKTWETQDLAPEVYYDEEGKRHTAQLAPLSEFATDWADAEYPDWCQFLELNTKRPYFYNRRTGECMWEHPSAPDVDVFRKEAMEEEAAWMSVPENAEPASLIRRAGAAAIDVAATFSCAAAFGMFVSGELSHAGAAIPAVGFSWWALFMGRDMLTERGTRSPGKKLLGIEIVCVDGTLPTRWHTLGRNLYLPVYAGTTLLMPWIFFFAAADLGALLFTPRQQRLGDFMGRTRVIKELPDRKERFAQKVELETLDDLKE